MKKRRTIAPLLAKAAVIAAAFFVGYWLFTPRVLSSPAQDLARAWQQLESPEALLEGTKSTEVAALLDRAATDPMLSDWALLGQAELLELQGLSADAEERYRAISEQSAASLDARLALLRIAPLPDSGSPAEAAFGQALVELEKDIQQAHRRDLLPEVLLLKARSADHNADTALARSLYTEVRKSYPRAPAADRARVAMRQMAERQGQLPGERSIAELLAEAALLLQEQRSDDALGQAQLAKTKTQPGTPAFLEAMLLEEEILRRTGRNEEADRELALISADGGIGSGDRALLKMTRLAWNQNEQDRALEFIDNFRKRFSQSPLQGEMLYMKGRIFEEKQVLSEAKAAYRNLTEVSTDPATSLKALRQLAWIYYREGDYARAAEQFHAASSTAAQAMPSARGDTSRTDTELKELSEDLLHSTFWEGVSLMKVGDDERVSLSYAATTPLERWQEVAINDPYGYYGYLARRFSAEQGVTLQTAAGRDFGTPCTLPVDESLKTKLEVLHGVRLHDLTQFEIDWWAARLSTPDAEGVNAATETDTALKKAVTRTRLYIRHGLISRGLGYLDAVLLQPPAINRFGDPTKQCGFELAELRYPLAFRTRFEDSAEQHAVPIALLLAVSRTESHFDPTARSPKDAQGLLQLLPSTATAEGLEAGQDLFDPQVNIH
ncbi:MAG: transglycosylase SLT domain-containing protein, partial [Bdellovibrionales bacterium]|nr:transglycosylase SLT domain-containing protein [Bdellovibrionales bacterium]